MTVAELIALLLTKPQNLPVTVPCDAGTWAEVDSAEVAEPSEAYPEEFEYDDLRGVAIRAPHVRVV